MVITRRMRRAKHLLAAMALSGAACGGTTDPRDGGGVVDAPTLADAPTHPTEDDAAPSDGAAGSAAEGGTFDDAQPLPEGPLTP